MPLRRRKRILLVEDDVLQAPMIVNELHGPLAEIGIDAEFIVADSELEALIAIGYGSKPNRFDLYVIDLMLPFSQADDPELAMAVFPDYPADAPFRAGERIAAYIRDSRITPPDGYREMLDTYIAAESRAVSSGTIGAGFRVIEAIREQRLVEPDVPDASETPPIILYTIANNEEIIAATQRIEGCHFKPKDFDNAELASLVVQLMSTATD